MTCIWVRLPGLAKILLRWGCEPAMFLTSFFFWASLPPLWYLHQHGITDSCNPYILVVSWIVLHCGSERAFLHHGLSNYRNPSILWHPCPFTVIIVSIITSDKTESWFIYSKFQCWSQGRMFRKWLVELLNTVQWVRQIWIDTSNFTLVSILTLYTLPVEPSTVNSWTKEPYTETSFLSIRNILCWFIYSKFQCCSQGRMFRKWLVELLNTVHGVGPIWSDTRKHFLIWWGYGI